MAPGRWRGTCDDSATVWDANRVRRLMRLMSLRAVAPQPNTSRPAPQGLSVFAVEPHGQAGKPGMVRRYDLCAHGTRFFVSRGDHEHSRKMLAFRLSNTQNTTFCVEATARYGCPGLFNTDQANPFTSGDWTNVLQAHGVQISMDDKG